MNKLTFAMPLSIGVFAVSSMLATGQQSKSGPVIVPVQSPVSQPVPGDELLSIRPLNTARLADFLGVQGGSFSFTTSGTQSRTGYRLLVYLEGKPVGQIPWQFESSMWGRQKDQELTIILMNVEDGIKVSLDINGKAVIGRTIKLESKTRPDYFRPIKNKDGSVSLSAKWKDGTLKDLDPSTGNMVVVLEAKEESEQAGTDQPAINPADKVRAKDQPSSPTSKDGPR